MRHLYVIILMVIILAGPLCSSAFCQIVGSVDYNFGGYSATQDGAEVADGDYFAQRYYLAWKHRRDLNGGRAGKYSVLLGAEWAQVNTSINDEEIDVNNFKPVYSGHVILAPGGLPFRLEFYHGDVFKSTYVKEARLTYGGNILPSGLISDVRSGTYLKTGLTLQAGIKNGSYLGRFREILSKYPRLFIDYSNLYVKDDSGVKKLHYKESKLAFVSLNKKDNWFHFREHLFDDKVILSNNFRERDFILGTIDNKLERHWIHLTNWIRLSVDGSLELSERGAGQDIKRIETYTGHLFTAGRRNGFSIINTTTFRRKKVDNQDIDSHLTIPFLIKDQVNRDTHLASRVIFGRDDYSLNNNTTRYTNNNVFASVQLSMRQNSRIIVQPTMSAEYTDRRADQSQAVSVAAEAYTNSRYRPKYNFYGSGKLTVVATEKSQDEDAYYYDFAGGVGVDRRFNNRSSLGLSQNLIVGSGTIGRNSLKYTKLGSLSVTDRVGPAGSVDDEMLLRSRTSLRYDFALGRVGNTLSLNVDYAARSGSGALNSYEADLRHETRYSQRHHRFWIKDFLTYYGGSVRLRDSYMLDSAFGYEYTPNKLWMTYLALNAKYENDGLSQSYRFKLREKTQRSYFTRNGRVRRVARWKQELRLEHAQRENSDPLTFSEFSLYGAYYPTAITELWGRGMYRYINNGTYDTHEMSFETGLAFNWRKLQVSLEYGYGFRPESDLVIPERVDHRWEVNISKQI